MVTNDLNKLVEGGKPIVSVVVPSFNHASYVERTLRSIFAQTLKPDQLVVIDDGSTDDSVAVIERALESSSIDCQLISQSNIGLSATLNKGLILSRGEYFAYLGSDDIWLPNFLEQRVASLAVSRDAVLAYGHCYLIDDQDDIIDCTGDWAEYTDGDATGMLLQGIGPMSPTVVYRRSALVDERWHEGSRLEDYDLYLRLSCRGQFKFDPQVLSAWRQHGSNTSHDQAMMLAEQLKAQSRLRETLGLTSEELKRIQARVGFSKAEDFLRYGDKRTALRVMVENRSGASSARVVARIFARLVLPYGLVSRYRKNKNRDARKRYGSLRDLYQPTNLD